MRKEKEKLFRNVWIFVFFNIISVKDCNNSWNYSKQDGSVYKIELDVKIPRWYQKPSIEKIIFNFPLENNSDGINLIWVNVNVYMKCMRKKWSRGLGEKIGRKKLLKYIKKYLDAILLVNVSN